MSHDMSEFMKVLVRLRKNIIISGGTGTGKTTLLNVLSGYIGSTERIITIEDSAELKLQQRHVGRLETRNANVEGKGKVSIRDLVRNALRMRPDRIIIGECRGEEALDMLQAMNTGHDGSISTVHSNSPLDALSRLETMVLMAGMELPARAIREQIVAAVDIIIQIARLADGTRKITNISEVTGMDGLSITVEDIFKFVHTGINKDGFLEGHFTATGYVPSFSRQFKAHGIDLDMKIFKEPSKKAGKQKSLKEKENN
jgi:pilus assembly protein CpaF